MVDSAELVAKSRPPSRGVSAIRPALDQLGTIYQENFDLVWRGLRRLGVAPASLDDAAQDVFLVVHRRLPEFEGRSALQSWIFGIAIHVARYYRRTAARFTYEEPGSARVDSFADDPSTQIEDRQALRLVYAALDRMSEVHREIFVLCDIEEMTAVEAAQLLGIPLNTVYSRLRHARAQFEASLERVQRAPRRLP